MDQDRIDAMKLRSLRMRLKGYLASGEATPEGTRALEEQIRKIEEGK